MYILTRFYFFSKFDTNSHYNGVVVFIFWNNLIQNVPTMVFVFGWVGEVGQVIGVRVSAKSRFATKTSTFRSLS